MNKTLARVLAAILVLAMLPATFLTALASGYGVAKDETENQSIDNANGQFIPETIQIDGEFDDTGWPIEGWNYVTSSSGNWNVFDPASNSQEMMYQYQLRSDYKYFYGAAVVVFPETINSVNFVVYLSCKKSGKYELTSSTLTFALDNTGKVIVSATDCDTSDTCVPDVTNINLKDRYEKKNGNHVFYLEFANLISATYDSSASEIRYYVSLDSYYTEGGENICNSLYHPVYYTNDGFHSVPTSEFWPGGGNLLEVSYTDLSIRYNGSMYYGSTPSKINTGTDGFKGAVELDGALNEEIWKGLNGYYLNDGNFADFVNADKGIVGGTMVKGEYTGTMTDISDMSTVHYLPNNLVAGNEYFASKTVREITQSKTHDSYLDDGYELTDGKIVNDYAYLTDEPDESDYHNDKFCVWNTSTKSTDDDLGETTGLDVRIPLGNGNALYPLQVVRIYTATEKCNPASGSTEASNGIWNQNITVEYTDDGITWKTFGSIAKDNYNTTYTRENVVSVTTPVMAMGIRITSAGASELIFLSEVEAFSSNDAATAATSYNNSTTAANAPTFVGKYDFRLDDEYFYGALITTSGAQNLNVGGVRVTTSYLSDCTDGYKYEFRVEKDGLDFNHTDGVSVTVNGVRYTGLIVNRVNNDLSDEIVLDGRLLDSIWAPVTAGDNKFDYVTRTQSQNTPFVGYENIIYDVKTDYEYVYGAAIVKMEDISKWTKETTKLRLYINPYSYIGTGSQDERRVVEMYYTNTSNITDDNVDRSFARVLRYNGKSLMHENMSYRWSELCYIRKDTANNTLTFEFKIPYKLFGWEGPKETSADATGYKATYELSTDIAKADSGATLFTYYVSLCSTQNNDTLTETLFSKGIEKSKTTVTTTVGKADAAYKQHATTITYNDIIDTVKIDGHIDDAVWQDEDKQFYHADFANSTVINEPKVGRVYDYSYMVYGGSNYIYGAVEFNGKAKADTTFTLWINNFVDETKWIGDNDPKTPHIIYDIYSKDAQINEYTGAIVNGSTQPTGNKITYTTNELRYHVNYKYEFNLAGGEAVVEPDYYFPTDSNLEKDKVKIEKDKNYKYAVTSINGKTYLEFMIDVDNFHWDGNSFEYVTSMTHKVTKADDGAYSDESLTIYHPQINDRINWWLTNFNSRTSTLPDGNGILYTDADKYQLPPTAHMYAYKFEPVQSSKQADGTYTQYRMIEKRSGYYWYRFDTDGVTILKTWNDADGKSASAADWQPYTKAESDAGIIMIAYYDGQYWSKGHRGAHHANSILTYTNRRPVDYTPVYDTATQELYYVAANVFDSNTERGKAFNSQMYNDWELGDIFEFGQYNTDIIEDKTKDKNVITVTGDSLSGKADLIQHQQTDVMFDIFGEYSVNYSNEHKAKLNLGDDLGFKYMYADYAEMSDEYYNETRGDYTGFTGGDGIFGNGKLNDDLGPNGGKATTVIGLGMNNGGEKHVSEIITQMDIVQQTNVYTAYLSGGFGGIYNDGINMEIYGSNDEDDEKNWDWITAASYRQLILTDGDGVTRYVYGADGKLASQDANNATRTIAKDANGKSRIWLDTSFNANVESSSSMSVLDDNEDFVADLERKTYNTLVDTLGGKAAIFNNKKATTSDAEQSFRLCFELSAKVDVDSVAISWVNEVYNDNIGVFGRKIKVYTSEDGTNWVHKTQATSGAAITKYRVTDYYAKKMQAKTSSLLFDDHVNTKYIALEFSIPKIESAVSGLTATEKSTYLNSAFGTLKTWHRVAITEIDFNNHPIDDYTLTAVAEKPYTYKYIKYRFTKIDNANNAFGLEELDMHYSEAIANLPKKTILHLNTDQGYTKLVEQTAGQHDYALLYKGKYNTAGETWTNDTNDKKYTSHNNISNVMPETVLYPNYSQNTLFDTGFYTDYYIERVGSAEIAQPNQPQHNNTDKWDGRNSNVLKPLQHISPDVIDVDGNLNDTGWDGTWTDVDGLINATDTAGTGVDYTYQMRADGEYLYLAAVIDSNYDTDSPELKLWIKSNDAAETFTHLYSVGAGQTELVIGAQATDSNGVVDAPYLVYQYGDEQIDGSITINGKIGAIANNSLKPNGLKNVTNNNNYLDSYIFGYTKEVQESTHDGIWVWDANPITQGHRVALEHACINSADGKTVGNAVGDPNKTIVEFRVKLSEFGGADGFEYFLEVSDNKGCTVYPHIYSEDGYTDYHHPSWAWDSTSAKKVTKEDMTGWGIYRMVNDYAPMTSLGARINSNYGEEGKKAIRFGARYTEEFIRRKANVDGIDYWDVADAGIVFVPTHVIPDKDPYSLDVDTPTAKVVTALDIVNWKNETPDSKTNFADYTTFVFYVNLVGVPDTATSMPFAFRGFIDYYNASGCDTYYGIPLERSYSHVERTINESILDFQNWATSIEVEFGAGVKLYDYYTGNGAEAAQVLIDKKAPVFAGEADANRHMYTGVKQYAYLFENSDPVNNTNCTFSTILEYEKEIEFDSLQLGLYMVPQWKIAPPKSVTVYVNENGNWVQKTKVNDIYTYDEDVIRSIMGSDTNTYERTENVSVYLGEKYKGQQIKLEFEFLDFVYVEGMNGVTEGSNWKQFQFVGLTEIGLS